MKKIFAMLVMVVSMNAFAQNSVDISSLTPEQKAQVLSMVETKKVEAPAVVVDAVLTRVEQFSVAAARGLVGFAKEIGVEVNNFSQTPLGKVVAFVTIMHFFGSQITALLLGSVLMFIAFPFFSILTIRSLKTRDYKYSTVPVLYGLWARKVVTETTRRDLSDAEQFRVVVYLVASVASIFIGGGLFVL